MANAKFSYPDPNPNGVILELSMQEAMNLLGLLNNVVGGAAYISAARNALANLFPDGVYVGSPGAYSPATESICTLPYTSRKV